jgi:hypothetical protein
MNEYPFIMVTEGNETVKADWKKTTGVGGELEWSPP